MPPYAVRILTPAGWQDIAMQGPVGPVGPAGPVGPGGAVVIYEQPNAPASPGVGQVWIDTDDNPQMSVVSTAIPLVSSLPGSPVDGQEVYYLADATNGVIWHLRYRAAGGTYKWEVIGGPPLFNELIGTTTALSNSYSTAFCAITVPLAGNFNVAMGAMLYPLTAGQPADLVGFAGGSAINASNFIARAGYPSVYQAPTSTWRTTLAAANTVVDVRGVSGAGGGSMTYRWLSVLPTRVG